VIREGELCSLEEQPADARKHQQSVWLRRWFWRDGGEGRTSEGVGGEQGDVSETSVQRRGWRR